MNRRKRAGLAGAVLAVLLAVAGLIAAFAGATLASAKAAAAKPSGILSWAPLTGLTSTWDPALVGGGSANFQVALVYDSLTRIEPNGSVGPDLATSWKFLNKGLTLQLNLRHGVKFTDGTSFNANAVKVNLQYSQTVTGSASAADLAPIQSIQVVNNYEVSLHLSSYDYSLPLILGYKDGMIVSPKALETNNGAALSTTADGSGPFILTSYVPNGYAELTRNPNYWDANDIHLAGVRLDATSDPSVALAGLESGQLDVAGNAVGAFPAIDIKAAKAAGLGVDVYNTIGDSDITVDSNVKPFNNPLVLKALNYATNRAALVKTLNLGIGEPATEIFPPGYPGYSATAANLYPYNVAKAKQLLTQAGYPNGIQITLYALQLEDFPAVAELLQSQWAEAGITVTIDDITETALLADEAQGIVGAFTNTMIPRASPVQGLEAFYGAQAANNPCHCITPALSQALAKLAKIPTTSPKYDAALQAATLAAAENGPPIILDTLPTIYAYSKKVVGLRAWDVYPRLEGVYLR
jgi:peptide/nickel transport system substrate-binding protein